MLSQISIHALLAESDDACIGGIVDNVGFLSTLSLRRATLPTWDLYQMLRISIHALLAESDCHISCNERHDISISIHALLAESDSPAPKA